MSYIRGFFAFWYDFIIGDDWKIAVAVTLALATTGGMLAAGVDDAWATSLGGACVMAYFTIALLIDQRPKRSAD